MAPQHEEDLMPSSLTALSLIASLLAIVPCVAQAQGGLCQAPAKIEAGSPASVNGYRAIFQQCHNAQDETRLAIRRMSVNAQSLLLMVDPTMLATRLEQAQCWTCADTTDEAQKDTRFIRAVQASAQSAVDETKPQDNYLEQDEQISSRHTREPDSAGRSLSASPYSAPASFNAGLSHSAKDGSFITGDLCPSRRPLDRTFLEKLAALGTGTPVALSISGLWLKRHGDDFEWLRAQARSGALQITWVNHSYHHPYIPWRKPAQNFLLMPGVNIEAEILETERLLIAMGETPSVFFRFPGLISNAALMNTVRRNHLVTLGADAWLVFAPPLRPGTILLVHPNGNEPMGLKLFSKLLEKQKLPRPFRPIDEAPR
jgi:hypothetical protein